MHAWTTEHARAFLEATRDDRLAAGWALLLTRGLRRGELAGLRWGSVDLDAGVLSIAETRIVVNGNAANSTGGLKGSTHDPARRGAGRPPATPTCHPGARASRGRLRVRPRRPPGRRRAWAALSPRLDQRAIWAAAGRHGPPADSPARLSTHCGQPHAGERGSDKGRQRSPRAFVADDHAHDLRPRHAGNGRASRRCALGEPARVVRPPCEIDRCSLGTVARKRSGFVIPSALIVAFGIILGSWKSSDHGVCSSGQELPGQDCTGSEIIYYAGIVLIVLGVALLVAGLASAVVRDNRPQTPVPTPAPPGWVAHPTKPGWTIWWDGTKYAQERPPEQPPSSTAGETS